MHKTTLYIVPTPIGNLQDITYRALFVLKKVNYIVAESVQRIQILLNFFSIRTPFYIMNRYNESFKTPVLISKLEEGYNIALVSDAGTPLISDPGYRLIRSCRIKKIRIVSLPGPCSVIAALCASGLPTDRFCFEGFLSSKQCLRINRLKILSEETRTLIFYEVKHRIIHSLQDMISVFGKKRYVVLVRELSKIWESIYGAPLAQLLSWLEKDRFRIQGEMVLVVSGNSDDKKNYKLSSKVLCTMRLLASELPVKKAAILTGQIYGIRKNILYKTYLNEK